jgi:hypothetical protein
MSHKTLLLDEVARCTRWMVGGFRQEDIDKVLMRPNQGFDPLVSVVLPVLSSPFLQGLIDLTRRPLCVGSVSGQGLVAVGPRRSRRSIGEMSLRGPGEERNRHCEDAA